MEPTTYTLALSFDEIVQAGNALAALPYAQVAPLLQKIAGQVEEQKQKHAAWLEEQKSRNRS